MLARGVTRMQLDSAAKAAGVQLNDVRAKGSGWLFTLRPEPWTGKGKAGGQAKFYRKGFMAAYRKNGEPNTVNALCWHGHRDFFRRLFTLAPASKVQTRATRESVPGGWYTADNFEREFGRTDRNIGSMMHPMAFSEACWCREQGREDSGGVTFGTLTPDAGLINTRVINRSTIAACPFTILVPDHYAADGSCECLTPEGRARMISEWDYTLEDFARAGLVSLWPREGEHVST